MAHPLFVRHPGLQQGGAMDQDGPHQFSELSLRSKHGRRPRQRYPATMAFLPFALRRPWLLVRDLVVDRGDPDLEALGRLTDPERFLWAILPHAARTFSASIAMLPARSAKASAVAYLYCRMLDTYEDLVPQVAAREAALSAFADRFRHPGSDGLLKSPPKLEARIVDSADRAHVLLVERCELVDRIFSSLEPAVRTIIQDLVSDMARGMVWGSNVFEKQHGVLQSEEQLLRYCREVLGNPVVYVARLSMILQGKSPDLTLEQHNTAMRAGEFVQLANITRDVEKDLAREVAYSETLAQDLGRKLARPRASFGRGNRDQPAALHEVDSVDGADPELVERVRLARARFLQLALERASDYERFIDLHRSRLLCASTLLLLLFTDRHYRGTAARIGHAPWGKRRSSLTLLMLALPSTLSRSWTRRLSQRIVSDMTAASQAFSSPAPSVLPQSRS
jgi:phytoene/squalene synthetase